jgi:beta-galactosidase/beta-glucuronidase
LNSNGIFLKGVSWAEETKTKGASLDKDDYEEIFSLALQANCNFLRFSTHGRHPMAYESADKMGMLVMSEWDTFWMKPDAIKTQLNDPYSMAYAATMIGVWDRVNNPSVILWGLHNESDQFNDSFIPFLKKMKKIVKTIDWQNRLISFANWHPYWGKAGHEISDLVGFNEYRGFFDPFERLLPDLKKVRNKYPGKLMLITENGAWSKKGYRGDKSKGGSEEWHSHIIQKQMSIIAPHKDWFAGYTFWKLTDYRSRKDDYTKKNEGYSLMGMYDSDYNPKLVRDTVKKLVPEL